MTLPLEWRIYGRINDALKAGDIGGALRQIDETRADTARIGAEIAATVAREGFWDLDAPIERIGAAPTPSPYSPDLERAWLPDREDITDALRRLAAV